MKLLDMSQAARQYYERLRAKSLAQGWEKYVATDGYTCLFVNSSYDPQPGEAVFFLSTRNFNTSVQLYKQNIKDPGLIG